MEIMAKTTGGARALLALAMLGSAAACVAPAQTGAHATTAAALWLNDATTAAVSQEKPRVRVRLEDPREPAERAALVAIRRTLTEQGFDVASALSRGDDVVEPEADLVVHAAREDAALRVVLSARIGARVMVPMAVDAKGDGSAADDEAFAELAMRWQRRFNRSPRLDRHLVQNPGVFP